MRGWGVIDQVSLFLHIVAAVGLVGGGFMQVLVGGRLRAASTPTSIGLWGQFAMTASTTVLVAGVTSFLTGGHLAAAVWSSEEVSGFSRPFISVGVGALVLAGVVWFLVNTRLRRLVDRALSGEGARLVVDTRSSSLWGPVHGLVGIGVGLIWIMSAKPERWLTAIVVVLGTLVVGWITGLLVSTRTT